MWRHGLMLVAFSSLLLLTRLGATRLWDQDEPRNAGCAAEMLDRGDWVTPVFNGQLRGHKPVLLYWLMMAAYSLLGPGELAARAGSALCAIGTVVCTYLIGRRLFDARTALWSGVMLSSCLMFVVAGRAATPDALLILCCTLAMTAFVLTSWRDGKGASPDAGLSQGAAVLLYASMALAVLAKGPVGWVLPGAVVGLYLLMSSQERLAGLPSLHQALRPLPARAGHVAWRLRPLTACAVLLLVAGPWYAWVGWRTEGRWLREFFLEHNWNRARSVMEGHRGPFFYYLLAVLPGFFPWSIFIAPTCLDAWRRWKDQEPSSPAIRFCTCWLVVWIGAFSLARTKLPSYITPCYPALALLTAHYLCRWMEGRTRVHPAWPWWSLLSLGLAGCGLMIALPLATARYLPGEASLALVGLPLLLAAGGAALWLARQQRRAVAWTVAGAACGWLLLLFAWAAPRVDRHQQVDRLLAHIPAHPAGAVVLSYGAMQPSWVYYLGRPIGELPDDAADPGAEARLAERLRQHPEAFIITTRRHYQRWQAAGGVKNLSSRPALIAQVPLFLKDEQLVLLHARRPADASRMAASRGGQPDIVRE